MKVLQLIDTLEAGGAERVAVNFANALSENIEGSFLCATRREGPLKESISKEVSYFFLNRTSTLDIKAIQKLNKFIKQEEITHVHAHATSYFIGTLVKVLNTNVKLIWHDHYGKSEFLANRSKRMLKLCSNFFSHIIAVNSKLKDWAIQYLNTKQVSYIPNFAELQHHPKVTILHGIAKKRIVCLANFRPQKDHLTLLRAFKEITQSYPEWTLHLVGQDFKDDYSKSIVAFIKLENLVKNVFIYGSCSDVSAILKQCDIAVLSSKSEGLPLALIEYGLAGLPTIATNVGDCGLVISNKQEGHLIKPQDVSELKIAIEDYINNSKKAKLAGEQLKEKVKNRFSKTTVVKNIISIYKSC